MRRPIFVPREVQSWRCRECAAEAMVAAWRWYAQVKEWAVVHRKECVCDAVKRMILHSSETASQSARRSECPHSALHDQMGAFQQ